MTRLNDAQRETLAPLLPIVKWVAAKYHPDTFDDAMDGAIHAVRTHDPSRGPLNLWVKRNASLYITRRPRPSSAMQGRSSWKRRSRLLFKRIGHYDAPREDPSLRYVEARDEVRWHLKRAAPKQRDAMETVLRGDALTLAQRQALRDYSQRLQGCGRDGSRQRRCMLAILRDEPYRGRMVGIAEYRRKLR